MNALSKNKMDMFIFLQCQNLLGRITARGGNSKGREGSK